MKIENIKELEKYLKENNLANDELAVVLRETLGVFIGKDEATDDIIDKIEPFYNKYLKGIDTKEVETPIFLN